jgi:thiamine kinase-like enzyme
MRQPPDFGHALEAAFGVSTCESIMPLEANDGLSQALVYRIEVAGKPYLLRFVKETMPGVDPTRELDLMRRAASVGVAPRVHYAEDKVLITDLVDAKPYPADAATRLAATLRRLHDLPPVAVTTRYAQAMDGFVKRLPGLLPADTLAELMRGYDAAHAAYPHDESGWVICHHDLKPQNMLFDGERFWLIDWEAAFMDDRYVDLAVAASFVGDDEALLAAYFGQPPTAEQRRRLFLMSVLVSVYYVAVFGLLARLPWEPGLDVPAFEALNRRIVGGFDLASPEAKRLYAHVHLNRALEQMRSQRFAQAVS